MILDEANHRIALAKGAVAVPNGLSPFINVDPGKYTKLESESRRIELNPFRKRYSLSKFRDLRAAVSETWHCAMTYFPAYRFQVAEYINDEWLASVDFHKGFHRDHVRHQVFVYYVARTLLDGGDLSGLDATWSFKPNGKSLREHILDAILHGDKAQYLFEACRELGAPERFWKERNSPATRYLWGLLVDETLCLACFFHDIGYPWQFVAKVDSALKNHQPLSALSTVNDGVLTRFGNRLLGMPFKGYIRTDPSFPMDRENEAYEAFKKAAASSHGLPGAVAFLHLNDVLRPFPDPHDLPSRRFCLEWAAMAIMMHDLQSIYAEGEQRQLRLDFFCDPMSFLLTLADQIQDFSRPNAAFHPLPPEMPDVRLEYTSKCSHVELGWDARSNQFTITYCYKDPRDFIKNRDDYKKKAWEQYFDPVEGFLDYSAPALGINRIVLKTKLIP